jgi:antitoxin PrlF
MSIAKKTFYSKLSVKSQTVLPQEVRQLLHIGPGDRLRYVVDELGVHIDKEPRRASDEEDPFAVFSEWASDLDNRAYDDL